MEGKTMYVDGNVEKQYKDGKVLYEKHLDKITSKVNEIAGVINNADPWAEFSI